MKDVLIMMRNKEEVEKLYTLDQIEYEQKMKENGIINPNDHIIDAVATGIQLNKSCESTNDANKEQETIDGLMATYRQILAENCGLPTSLLDGVDLLSPEMQNNMTIPSNILQSTIPPINSVYIPSRHQGKSTIINGAYSKFPQTYIKTYEGVYVYKGFMMDSNGKTLNNVICKLNDDIDIEIPNEDIIFRSSDLWDMCNQFIIIEKLPSGIIKICKKFHKSERHAFIRNFGDLLLIGNKNIRAFGLYKKDYSKWNWNEDEVIAELDYKFPIDENSLYLTDYDDTKW